MDMVNGRIQMENEKQGNNSKSVSAKITSTHTQIHWQIRSSDIVMVCLADGVALFSRKKEKKHTDYSNEHQNR